MKPNQTNAHKYTLSQIAVFFVITFAITWSMFFLGTQVFPEQFEILFIIAGAFGPFAAALIVIRLYKRPTTLHKLLPLLSKKIFYFKRLLILSPANLPVMRETGNPEGLKVHCLA